jgi:hypothetical protein
MMMMLMLMLMLMMVTYLKSGVRSSSLASGKPDSISAFFHGVCDMPNMPASDRPPHETRTLHT